MDNSHSSWIKNGGKANPTQFSRNNWHKKREGVRRSEGRLLFESNRLAGGMAWGRNFDISPDGKRFLMITSPPPPAPPTEYHVILNWAQELKRLAPGK